MENNDSNLKPQPTGGLKLMTVFIAVLALHVAVIGGFTVYHLMSGGSTDADLTMDKTHKGLKVSPDGSMITDGTLPDAGQGDKSGSTPAPVTEVANIPANPTTASPDQTASTETSTLTPSPTSTSPTSNLTPEHATPTSPTTLIPVPAPATTTATPAGTPIPTTLTPSPAVADQTTSPMTSPTTSAPSPAPSAHAQPALTTTATASTLAPPPEPTATPEPSTTPEPSAPAPFVGPVKMPSAEEAVTSAAAPVHHQIYTVKITDSYKKIAHAHHITVAQLKEANNIKNNVLHTGQKLIIPASEKEVATTASSTSLDSAPTGPILSTSTPAPTAMLASAPSSTTTPMTMHHHLYTVVKGDTLTRIAHRFKTTATALMEANNITDPTKLSIGKKLKIPSQESRSAKNSEPAADRPNPADAKPSATTAQLANYVR